MARILRSSGRPASDSNTIIQPPHAQTAQSENIVDTLAAAAENHSVDYLMQKTHNFIAARSTAADKLDCIKQILSAGAVLSEKCGAVLTEAWSILLTDKLWSIAYPSQAEAVAALDTPQLQQLRKIFGDGGRRKDKAIKRIYEKWGTDAEELNLRQQGEHYLEQITRVSNRFGFDEAVDLVDRIRADRLRQDRTGRGSSRDRLTSDWQTVANLTAPNIKLLKQAPVFTGAERIKYGIESAGNIGNRGPAGPKSGDKRLNVYRAGRRQAKKIFSDQTLPQPSTETAVGRITRLSNKVPSGSHNDDEAGSSSDTLTEVDNDSDDSDDSNSNDSSDNSDGSDHDDHGGGSGSQSANNKER